MRRGVPHPAPERPDGYPRTRHSLAAVLLRAGQPVEAEQLYREDLKRFPESGWSLFGLAQALRAQGKSAAAADVDARFTRAWGGADVTLTASRFSAPPPECRPYKHASN